MFNPSHGMFATNANLHSCDTSSPAPSDSNTRVRRELFDITLDASLRTYITIYLIIKIAQEKTSGSTQDVTRTGKTQVCAYFYSNLPHLCPLLSSVSRPLPRLELSVYLYQIPLGPGPFLFVRLHTIFAPCRPLPP